MLSVLVHDYGTALIEFRTASCVAKADSYAFVDDRVVWSSVDKKNCTRIGFLFPKAPCCTTKIKLNYLQ